MNTLLLTVQFAATLGCGLMAGVFFIFSNTLDVIGNKENAPSTTKRTFAMFNPQVVQS